MKKIFEQMRPHTVLMHGISTILTDRMPTFHDFGVHFLLASEFSAVYHVIYHVVTIRRPSSVLRRYLNTHCVYCVLEFVCVKLDHNTVYRICTVFFTLCCMLCMLCVFVCYDPFHILLSFWQTCRSTVMYVYVCRKDANCEKPGGKQTHPSS
jgi:hypothetical protein